MKRIVMLAMSLLLAAGLTACGDSAEKGDYPAAIMVDGAIYLYSPDPMPTPVEESAVIGYTQSYTDTFPEKNGETNFDRELNMPYANVDGGIAVLRDGEWHLCTPKES